MKNYLENEYNLDDNNLVSSFDELPLWSAPFGLKLLDTIKMRKNIKALDIGFGAGFPLIEIAMRLGNSSKIYGIDLWKGGIERSNFKISQYGINNIEIIKCMAENLPFNDEFFDLIVSNNGINNVENVPKVFEECFSVSKHGAQFVFTMNLDGSMLEFYKVYKDILEQNGMHAEIKKLQDHIYEKRKPVPEIEKQLKEAGYKISNIHNDLFRMRFSDCTTMLNHFFIKLAFLQPWKNILPSDKVENIFNQIEKKLNQQSLEIGELTLSIPFVTIDCKKK